MSTHIKTVQNLYEAFGRGDLPAILAHIADDVDWGVNADPNVTPPEKVSYFRRARNRDEVAKFYFEQAVELFEFHQFKPKAFMAGDQHVSVLLELELTARRTGKRFGFEEIHCFQFDPTGKICRYRGFLDTALIAAMNN